MTHAVSVASSRIDVVIAGFPGAGSRTLASALSDFDSDLQVAVRSGVGDRSDESVRTIALMAIDPSSLAGSDERDILDQLRTEAAHVGVVVTKVDAFWDWPSIARDSRHMIDPNNELAVFAVSAAAALAGAPEESGIAAVVEWIRDRDIEKRATGPVPQAPATPPSRLAIERLRARRSRLQHNRDRGRADRLAALRAGLGSIRSSALAQLSAGLRDISSTAVEMSAGVGRDDVADYQHWVSRATNKLAGDIEVTVRDEIERLRAVVLLGIEPVASPLATDPPPPVRFPDMSLRRRALEDTSVVVVGASAGAGLGRLAVTPLGAVDTLQWISVPVALLVGVVAAIIFVYIRRQSAVRAQVRAHTTDGLAQARAVIEPRLLGVIGEAEPVIAGRVSRFYERQLRATMDEVAGIDAEIRRALQGTETSTPASKS